MNVRCSFLGNFSQKFGPHEIIVLINYLSGFYSMGYDSSGRPTGMSEPQGLVKKTFSSTR